MVLRYWLVGYELLRLCQSLLIVYPNWFSLIKDLWPFTCPCLQNVTWQSSIQWDLIQDGLQGKFFNESLTLLTSFYCACSTGMWRQKRHHRTGVLATASGKWSNLAMAGCACTWRGACRRERREDESDDFMEMGTIPGLSISSFPIMWEHETPE